MVVGTVCSMISFRHRRRMRPFVFVAWAGPGLALAVTGAAFLFQGRWPSVAAAVTATVSLLLGGGLVRLDRRLRREYAIGRAVQAARFSAEHERMVTEHRSFTAHMVGMLDAATRQIGLQRGTIDLLESEITELRGTLATAQDPSDRAAPGPAREPSQELALLSDAGDWKGFWSDLTDVPTVVDLVAWDERNQAGEVPEPAEDIVERSA
jgi:hypothetical protein